MSFASGPKTASIVFASPVFAAANSPLPASSGEANTWYAGLAALLHPTQRMTRARRMRRLAILIVRVARGMPILQNLDCKRFINTLELNSFAVRLALESPATATTHA